MCIKTFSVRKMMRPLILLCPLFCTVASCQESSRQPPEEPADNTIVIGMDDLPEDLRNSVKKLIAKSVADAVNQSWQQDLGINDQVELDFFGALDRLVTVKDNKASYSICLIKPGSEVSMIRHGTIKDGERVILDYSYISAQVPDAIATITSISTGEGEPSLQVAVCHLAESGEWERVAEPSESVGNADVGIEEESIAPE